MEWTSKETLTLLYFLLPGFLAAWVFYGLTAHPKREAFDRIVQALIFTVIVKALSPLARVLWWSHIRRAGSNWSEDRELVASVVIAVLVGLIFAFAANRDWVHLLLRKLRITKRTSYPSEWYSAFHRLRRRVVLHLKGGRRLWGWPEEWPDQCDKGHFLIEDPKWVMDDGERIELFQLKRLMVAASDVEMVEIYNTDGELERLLARRNMSSDEMVAKQKPLIELHKRKESSDGQQGTRTSTKSEDGTVVTESLPAGEQ